MRTLAKAIEPMMPDMTGACCLERVSQVVQLAGTHERGRWLRLGEIAGVFPFITRYWGKADLEAIARAARELESEIAGAATPHWLACETTLPATSLQWRATTLVADGRDFPATVLAHTLPLSRGGEMLLAWQARPDGRLYQLRIVRGKK